MAKRSRQQHDSLEEYYAKRDFEATPEPSQAGDPAPGGSGLRFVVHKHDASRLHYDLRLELDGVLKSWAVPRGPSLDPAHRQLAVRTEDHPLAYASFEGVIPQGQYGGGTVMLWDRGVWRPLADPVQGLDKGDFKFELSGEKLGGAFVLARMATDGGELGESRNWLLIKKRDSHARPVGEYNVLSQRARSVASGRTMKEIRETPEAVWTDDGAERTPPSPGASERTRHNVDASGAPRARVAPMPETMAPQLATPADAAPATPDFLHEVKLDGYRLLAFRSPQGVRLRTRRGHDWTDRFPPIAAAVCGLPAREAILDGEIVVLDERGVPDFGALQDRIADPHAIGIEYFVFDLVYLDGHDLRKTPLVERKRLLEQLLGDAAPRGRGDGTPLRLCEHVVGAGPTVFAEAVRAGFEGTVAKRLTSPYEAGRRAPSWIKLNGVRHEDFVVGGWTDPTGSRHAFGALLLGQYERGAGGEDELVYRGSVGSGFGDAQLEAIGARLRGLAIGASAFSAPLPPADARKSHWVEPSVVVRVRFHGWTDDDKVRHAVNAGVRKDSDPARVEREIAASSVPAAPIVVVGGGATRDTTGLARAPMPAGDVLVAGVRISHPDRNVYPDEEVTKLDLARFYERIAPRMLPHVANRPLSLVRCPLGLAGEHFYQRALGRGFPEQIQGVDISDDLEDDKEGVGVFVRDAAGLVALAQMGVMEIHPWSARNDRLDRPDRLILDLDPGPELGFDEVAASAVFVRRVLQRIGLESFCKTSGGRGAHVVIPIERRLEWEDAKAFTLAIAKSLEASAPKNFVATMSKRARMHRVYVDYLRNQRGSTAVAAYSTRARPGAHVSMPVSWEDVESGRATPERFTTRTAPEIVERQPEPWPGFDALRQTVTAAMRRAVRHG